MMMNERESVEGIHPQFIQRWSPRAFSNQPITRDVLSRIIEAARWTPSCYNEQPWHIYTSHHENKAAYVSCLDEFNQQWAAQAPILGFIISDTKFQQNGKVNRYASFDCGAAWMAMVLQALNENVYMRAMGGIDKQAVSDYLGLSEYQHVMIGFAMGYEGGELPTELLDNANSMNRKPLHEIWITG